MAGFYLFFTSADTSAHVYFNKETLQVKLADSPLAYGAMEIERKRDSDPEKFRIESYNAIRRILAAWQLSHSSKHYIESYLMIERITDDLRTFQVVPYQSDGSAFQQLHVLWNSTVPQLMNVGKRVLLGEKKDFEDVFNVQEEPQLNWNYTDKLYEKPSVFTEEKKDAQRIFKGKYVSVLYPNRPTVHAHFLFIVEDQPEPFVKNQPKHFGEVSPHAFGEMMRISDKIISMLRKDGQIAIRSESNGSRAGQTVSEWHKHLMITEKPYDEAVGRLKTAAKIVASLCSTAAAKYFEIADTEISERVTYYRNLLEEELKKD